MAHDHGSLKRTITVLPGKLYYARWAPTSTVLNIQAEAPDRLLSGNSSQIVRNVQGHRDLSEV